MKAAHITTSGLTQLHAGDKLQLGCDGRSNASGETAHPFLLCDRNESQEHGVYELYMEGSNCLPKQCTRDLPTDIAQNINDSNMRLDESSSMPINNGTRQNLSCSDGYESEQTSHLECEMGSYALRIPKACTPKNCEVDSLPRPPAGSHVDMTIIQQEVQHAALFMHNTSQRIPCAKSYEPDPDEPPYELRCMFGEFELVNLSAVCVSVGALEASLVEHDCI